MVAAVQLERRVAGASIHGVVVCELRHQQEPCLVILLPIHKGTEVYFYRPVLSFPLPVCLRVERGVEPSLDAEEVTKGGPKLEHKNRSPITHDRVWQAVMPYNHVYNYFR